MNKLTVLVTHSEIPEAGLALLKKHGLNIIINEELPYPSKEEIIAKLPGVDAIWWSSKHNMDFDIIEKAGIRLKCVGVMSAGYDYVDVAELTRRGIKVGHAPKVFTNAVAEIAILLALAVARRVNDGRRVIENGKWSWGPQWMLGQELRGSKVGIVGFGGLGQRLAEYLRVFQVAEISYTGHNEKPEAEELSVHFICLNHLLSDSDFIFSCVPLTAETNQMFNKEAFHKMKKTAIFINVSRGGVVNQEDLVEVLKSRRIFGAGLDVMTPEPLPADHELLKLDNCVLLPHLGSATYRTRSDIAIVTAQNIIAGLKGEIMPGPVN